MRPVPECCVLVCGGGTSAQILAALLATRYRTIAVSLLADEAARWKAALGNDTFELIVEGSTKNRITSRLSGITNDPSAATDADVIFLTVPPAAQGEYFKQFTPHIKKGAVVAVMPARSGGDLLFASNLGDKAKDMVFVGFETVPWAGRSLEWGRKVTLMGTMSEILAAVTPPSAAAKTLSTLQGLLGVFPRIIESPNNLGISLRNPGMLIHPGVMYGCWGPESWDGKPKAEKPLFYQGVDEFTESVLLGMIDEVQAVRRRMEKLVPGLCLKDACTLKEWYIAFYGGQMSDTSTLRRCMSTNTGYNGLRHPCKGETGSWMPDLQYRYLAEDVPMGLCFPKGLAEILGIPTPTIDKVLVWAQGCLGLEIMVDGRMQGKDLHKTRAPQGVGVTTAEQFIELTQLRTNVKLPTGPGSLAMLAICCG